MSYIRWKMAQASSLSEAFSLCKQYARVKKNLSIEQIAELMGVGDESLRKWIRYATLPINHLASFEMVCGCRYVTGYLAARDGKLLIEIPSGKKVKPVDFIEMQHTFNHAIGLLMKVATGDAEVDSTVAAITSSMCDLAYHRENVKKNRNPELPLGEAHD